MLQHRLVNNVHIVCKVVIRRKNHIHGIQTDVNPRRSSQIRLNGYEKRYIQDSAEMVICISVKMQYNGKKNQCVRVKLFPQFFNDNAQHK
jgi:hypothetical protein